MFKPLGLRKQPLLGLALALLLPAAAAQADEWAVYGRDAGGTRTANGRRALAALDRDLRDPTNQRNPGTTADLTAAAIGVVILEDGWTPSGEVARAQ